MKIAIVSSSFYGFYEKALVQNAISELLPRHYQTSLLANAKPDIKNAVNQCFSSTIVLYNVMENFTEYFKKEHTGGEFVEIHTHLQKYQITLAVVPGGLEIPQAINWLVKKHNFDGILAIGCVIKGKTTHFEHVCNELMRGISEIAINTQIPITSAIVTSLTEDDAHERCIASGKNLGKKAMDALLSMVNLRKSV